SISLDYPSRSSLSKLCTTNRPLRSKLMPRTARIVFSSLGVSLLAATFCLFSAQAAIAVDIDWVHVGDVGNAPDAATGNLYGAVGYAYNIAKYDVTVGQYTDFLNAVAADDTYGLYNPSMTTNLNIAGIARSGSPGSYSYSVIGSANHPITYVNWG